MNAGERFDRALPELLHRLEGGGIPDYRDDIVRLTAGIRQRPAWTFPGRWLPMDLTIPRSPTAPFARALIVLALVALALVMAAALIAGGLLRVSRPAPPYGLAANGLLAYGQSGDIMVIDVRDGSTRPLVSGPEVDRDPTFSLDGTRLMFFRELTGEEGEQLMVAGADGTSVRALTTEPIIGRTGYEWSGDGRRILITSTIDGRQAMTLVEVADGATRRLGVDAGRDLIDADISSAAFGPPSGALVAFVVADGDDPDLSRIMVIGTEGDPRPRAITERRRGLSLPAFSPNGGAIAYTAADPDGRAELHVVGVDGRDDRVLPDPPGVQRQDGDPVWSPDGRYLLIRRWYEGSDPVLATVRADGSDQPGDQAQPGREFWGVAPEGWWWYTPDGTGIVYVPFDEATLVPESDPRRAKWCPVDPEGCPPVRIDSLDETISALSLPRNDDYSWQRRAP